ncbi:hypothetical protein [Streptomyces sp. NPDC019937]
MLERYWREVFEGERARIEPEPAAGEDWAEQHTSDYAHHRRTHTTDPNP